MTALAALICAPAGADAATVSSISMYSDPGDFVGQGAQRVYHAGNSTAIDASQRHGVLTAGADGGTRGDSFSFHFRGPDGRLPQPGVYVGAERLGFERPGHPAMDVEGMSRGCEDLGGGFEVRDLDLNAAGDVDRLWLVYHSTAPEDRSRRGARSGSARGCRTLTLRSRPDSSAGHRSTRGGARHPYR